MTITQIWITTGVLLYMICMLWIGYWAGKRVKSEEDYIVAGGQFGWFLSIGAFFATWFGAETCMGSSAAAFEKGILGIIVDPLGAGLCLIISGIFFARFFKRLGIETIIDFFEQRYGREVAWFFSILYLPVYIGWVGAQLLALGLILNYLTGLALMPSILISTAVVIIYTYTGGMWAVAMTVFFQMFILFVGLLIIFPTLLSDLGGFSAIKQKIPADFFHVYPRSHSLLDWLNYLQAWIIVGLGSLPAQDLIQQIMAAKNATISRWSSIIAGLLYIVLGMIPVLLGIFGRVMMPESTGESILLDLSMKYLSPILIALMVGALLSAIMSSADTALLAPAGIIGHNIVAYLKPNASDKIKLNWCKGSVPLLGILSLLLALYFQNIFRLCQEAWGILLAGVVVPLIAGVYWKKANASGAAASAAAGVITWNLFKIFLGEEYPCNLMGFLVSSMTLVVVSFVSSQKQILIDSDEKPLQVEIH